jgi:two-component system, cell cycle sensor histidine kinase and response regulator CckA
MSCRSLEASGAARRPAIPAAALLACAALAVCGLLPARADDDAGAPITVGVLADWPPYYLVDDDGQPSGFAVELIEVVAARAGLTLRFRTYESFLALQRALRAGEIDVVPSLGILPGREFRFSAPVDAFDVGVFVRESATGVRSPGDVRGRVAVVESNLGIELANVLTEAEPIVVADVREAIFRLLSGEFDALIYPSPVVWALARGARVEHLLVELEPALAEVKRAIAVATSRPDLHARLETALADLVTTRQYRDIYRRWHAPAPQDWTPRRIAVTGLALLGIFGLVFAIWRYLALRRFHRELRARERSFRALAEGLADCVMIVDPDGDVVRYVNPRCREVFGFDAGELVGRSIRDLLPAESLAAGDGSPRLVRLARADGSALDAEVAVGPSLPAATPPGYLLRVADVSARRRVNERIRFQAHLLDTVAEAVIATDVDGKVVFWNRFAEELYGWRAEEALGRPVGEMTTAEHALGDAAPLFAKAREGTTWSGELDARRRDGTVFPVRLTTSPIRDETDRVVGIVGASSDLTARRELEDRLRHAHRMESVGSLAGGVAHDFNNLLTVIIGNVELALHGLPEGDARRGELIEVQRAAERAAELTQQLLAFSRKQVVQPRVIDLNTVLRDTEKMLRRLLGEHITLALQPGERLGSVRADPAQLEQVVVNLAVNSRDALPHGGRLTLATANVALDDASGRLPPEVAAGEFVMLSVSDTGIGMDEATRQRIFDPFFTTKGPGEGTGLGLATVYGIVQQNGGVIEVETAPGAGATFRILLPRVYEVASAAAVSTPARPVHGHETILLVEDETSLRQLFARTLSASGYTVLAAGQPEKALDLARTHDGPIDLLLTDIVLPAMNGAELAARLARLRPETRVLYMSGYAESTIVHRGVLVAGARLLSKPFTIAALGRAVREMLDGAS